jgi:hypothetical protein
MSDWKLLKKVYDKRIWIALYEIFFQSLLSVVCTALCTWLGKITLSNSFTFVSSESVKSQLVS